MLKFAVLAETLLSHADAIVFEVLEISWIVLPIPAPQTFLIGS